MISLLFIFQVPLLLSFIIVLKFRPNLGVGYELYDSDDFQFTLPRLNDWCYQNKSCREATWSFLTASKGCHNFTHPIQFQSPINLPGNISQLVSHKNTKGTHYLNKADYIFDSFVIENTGRTLRVRPNFDWESSEQHTHNRQGQGAHTVTINKRRFFFHSLHFHWGSGDDLGSEHAIDGQSFPVEAHLVFYNEDYRDIKYPLLHWTDERGLLVIAIFLETDMANPELNANAKFHPHSNSLFPIVSSFKFLKLKRNMTVTSPLVLKDLFRGDRQQAYKYQGSMTTPPCRENVLWYVIRRPVVVPIWHIRAFRETEFFGTGKYGNNFRSLQNFQRKAKCKRNKNIKRVNSSRDIEMVTLNFKSPTKY